VFYELAGVVGGGIEESFEEEVGVEEIAGTFGTRDAARREEWLRAGSPLRAGISKKETERAPTGSPSRTSQRYKWVDDNSGRSAITKEERVRANFLSCVFHELEQSKPPGTTSGRIQEKLDRTARDKEPI